MPRRSIARLLAVPAAAALLAAGAATYAGAQGEPALDLEYDSFQILRQDRPDDEAEHAMVLRQGERYLFRIHYSVGGAPAIRTSHTYAFEDVATGRRLDVDSRSFDPDGPGDYNQYSAYVIPDDWEPGAYRLIYDLRATAVSAASASEQGSVVFLVAPALASAAG